ncbi:Accessory gene regulator protein B [bioreactor metagenome]|uniref:Accessory gene regulator protein B n=1 Tax=bioreactor metagenome TaxID=1076179 RepID=A0A645EUT1_9ZZZZ
MKKLSDAIAGSVASGLNLDENKRQVIAYGLLAMMQMAVILLFSVMIGLIFQFAWEAVIVYFGVGLLRKGTGGVHSESLMSCTVMSVTIICVLSAVSHYGLSSLTNGIVFGVIQFCLYLFCSVVIYKKAPMDTPNKPITKPEKIKRLRKQSFITLIVYFILSTVLFSMSNGKEMLISLSFSLNCALLWQVLTLTKAGAVIIHAGDRLLIPRR